MTADQAEQIVTFLRGIYINSFVIILTLGAILSATRNRRK